MAAELQNIVLPARNLQEAVYFYRDLLGFPTLVERDEFCILDAGGVNITIHPIRQGSEFVPSGHGLYLDVLVGKLEDFEARLKTAGIIIRKHWKDDQRRYILVADPDGNLVEIYESR